MTATYRVNDIDMHVKLTGSGVPLVMLHGFPLNLTMWDAQIDALASHCRVIAPDQRGFGHTPLGSRALTIKQLAHDLAALLDAMAVRDPAIICGLSMGGYVALVFQRIFPARVKALLLCDTRANADTPDAAADRLALAERVRQTGSGAVVDTMLPKLLGATTVAQQPELVDRVRAMMLGTSPDTMAAALRALAARPDSTPSLPQISVPTLAVVGEQDAITPPEVMNAMADAIPNCQRTIIAGAGHLSPMECPQKFNAAVTVFLGRPGVLA